MNNKRDKADLPSDDIPVSIIKNGMSLVADLSGMGANVMFYNKTCIIIGRDSHPYTLVASPEFDLLKLPLGLYDEWNHLKMIVLRSIFESEQHAVLNFSPPPSWLVKASALNYLTVDYIKLDTSFFLLGLPIKHLVLEEILIEDKNLIINHIEELKNLEYLVHRSLFTSEEVLMIEHKLPKLKVLEESEYEKRIENGEIIASP